jgi:diaminohydroxyphosphoribosylaminopyrimidine deaminase / 5-amino-6-(5-phosphoribosylamino)uracil reductase
LSTKPGFYMLDMSNEKLWEPLLALRDKVKYYPEEIKSVLISFHDSSFEIQFNMFPELSAEGKSIFLSKERLFEFPGSVVFILDENYSIKLHNNQLLDTDSIEFLLRYLPFCFGKARAYYLKRTFTVLHFAQTLDGRIATDSGESKWIGNDENLIHSHRMRALCDGILIGNNTLKHDKPSLNVRHVKGPNPVKIIIGNSIPDFESLIETGCRIIFCTSKLLDNIRGVECIEVSEKDNQISPNIILTKLYERGIFSLYIEGGAMTASTFLANKCIDVMQLFFAPKIFGSGVNNFTLPSLSNINNSVKFKNSSFKPMGDGVLFEGEICYDIPKQ